MVPILEEVVDLFRSMEVSFHQIKCSANGMVGLLASEGVCRQSLDIYFVFNLFFFPPALAQFSLEVLVQCSSLILYSPFLRYEYSHH